MPIEIKELHIKAFVGAKEKEPAAGIKPEDIARLKKEITKEVMEKVLKFIRQQNER
jgi:hypothetical protein